jgi:hypothetical protein
MAAVDLRSSYGHPQQASREREPGEPLEPSNQHPSNLTNP